VRSTATRILAFDKAMACAFKSAAQAPNREHMP
jgi:hypothetical protein